MQLIEQLPEQDATYRYACSTSYPCWCLQRRLPQYLALQANRIDVNGKAEASWPGCQHDEACIDGSGLVGTVSAQPIFTADVALVASASSSMMFQDCRRRSGHTFGYGQNEPATVQ